MTSRAQAKALLERAHKLLNDEAYIRLHGYTEIQVLLQMADIYLRISAAS